jgi:hypothetical protein
MPAREILHQSDFSFGDLISVDAGYADAFLVHVEHDLDSFGMFLVEDILEDLHNELLGCIIVIVQQNFVEGGLLKLLLGFGDHAVVRFGFPPANRI